MGTEFVENAAITSDKFFDGVFKQHSELSGILFLFVIAGGLRTGFIPF
jgi:hypothetical protein